MSKRHVIITDIKRGKARDGRGHYIYACVKDAITGELLVSADLKYCAAWCEEGMKSGKEDLVEVVGWSIG